jgi:hypothetical protein
VEETSDLWLVVFHDNGQATKSAVEAFEQTAHALRNMGSVGATTDGDLITRFSVTTFPSVRLFALKRDEPLAFEGELTGENLVNFVFDNARNVTIILYIFHSSKVRLRKNWIQNPEKEGNCSS